MNSDGLFQGISLKIDTSLKNRSEFNSKNESPLGKKEQSTSNTNLNNTAEDYSQNNSLSGIIEDCNGLKVLIGNSEKMLQNIYNEDFNFNEMKQEKIEKFLCRREKESTLILSIQHPELDIRNLSPVPNNFNSNSFASSLITLSERDINLTKFDSTLNEPLLYFLKLKLKKLSQQQKFFYLSHIPALRI